MRSRLIRASLILMLLLSLGLGQVEAQEMKETIILTGSTTVQLLAQKMALAFSKDHPGVKIKISGGGSEWGIRAICQDRTVDIGMSSKEPGPEDTPYYKDLQKYLIGLDAICVVVNPQNPVSDIPSDVVSSIFSGDITSWEEVLKRASDKAISSRSREFFLEREWGGEIMVVSRKEGSGTRACFEEKVMKERPIVWDAVLCGSNFEVRRKVAEEILAIGYISLGYLNGEVKPVLLDGIAPTPENCRSWKYPIARPLYFLTIDEPKGMVWEFIRFCQGEEGQKIIVKEGYISPH
jgi:phosphate transport system substrate-binding protein